MDVFLGFWMLTLLTLAAAMPFSMLLYGHYRNKKADERLKALADQLILEAEINNKKSA
mgnify:FL=1|jgi:hypothetical protein